MKCKYWVAYFSEDWWFCVVCLCGGVTRVWLSFYREAEGGQSIASGDHQRWAREGLLDCSEHGYLDQRVEYGSRGEFCWLMEVGI